MIDFKGPAERKGCLSSSSCSPNRRRGENIKISSLLLFLSLLSDINRTEKTVGKEILFSLSSPLFLSISVSLKKSFPPPRYYCHYYYYRRPLTSHQRGYENQEEEKGKVGGSPFFHRHTDRKWREGFAEYFNLVLGKEKNIARTAFLNYFKTA